MSYNILDAKIEFRNGFPVVITLLVEISKGDVRAIAAGNRPMNGYTYISKNAKVSDSLLQDVAGYGYTLSTAERDIAFPDWRLRHCYR